MGMLTKLEFLLYGFKHRCYQRKAWLLSVFTMVSDTPANSKLLAETPLALQRGEKNYYFIDFDGTHKDVDGSLSMPLFYKNDKIRVGPADHPFMTETVDTTVGIFLTNIVLFYVPFQNKVKYHNGLITGKLIKGIIDGLMIDNKDYSIKTVSGEEVKEVKEWETIPADKATVNDCLRLTKQANYLLGMNNVFVKAASIKAMTVNPEIIKLRDQRFEEFKDQLHDPVVVAKIIDELVALDFKDQMEGDSSTFYIDEGFIENARKKMFIVFGMEQDFSTGEYKLLRTPLNEKWDLNEIGTYVNTAILGAYSRGKATGEGGAAVKELGRLTSRISIAEDDCHTPRGEPIAINKSSLKAWSGGFYISGKEVKLISRDNKELIGQTIMMRVPQFCQTKNGNLCKTCCGTALGKSANQVPSEVKGIATTFMLTNMKLAHVSTLKTVKLDLMECLA